jgi:chitinase
MKQRAIIIGFFLAFTALIVHGQDKRNFKIVGYYSLEAARKNHEHVPFKRLTHLNLWFLNPDSSGVFKEQPKALKKFIDKAHRKHVKVLFSIGGGSPQPQYRLLLQPEHRGQLIRELVKTVLSNNADGVDVDLEGAHIDENYEGFVLDLREALNREGKLLTAAIAIYYKDQFTDRALAQFDFVNVMSYDRTGPWRPDRPGPHARYEHAVEDLTYFGSVRNIPREKMTLGVPFYGYGYDLNLVLPPVSMDYHQIVETLKGSQMADEWTLPDGKVIYYNGEQTIKEKTDLAGRLASGIMIWQIRGDAKGSRSLLRIIKKASSKIGD